MDGGAFEVEPDPAAVKFFDRERGRTFMHPGSVCFKAGKYDSGFVVYTSMTQTSKLFVREGEREKHLSDSLPPSLQVLVRYILGCSLAKLIQLDPFHSLYGASVLPPPLRGQSDHGRLCWAALRGRLG